MTFSWDQGAIPNAPLDQNARERDQERTAELSEVREAYQAAQRRLSEAATQAMNLPPDIVSAEDAEEYLRLIRAVSPPVSGGRRRRNYLSADIFAEAALERRRNASRPEYSGSAHNQVARVRIHSARLGTTGAMLRLRSDISAGVYRLTLIVQSQDGLYLKEERYFCNSHSQLSIRLQGLTLRGDSPAWQGSIGEFLHSEITNIQSRQETVDIILSCARTTIGFDVVGMSPSDYQDWQNYKQSIENGSWVPHTSKQAEQGQNERNIQISD